MPQVLLILLCGLLLEGVSPEPRRALPEHGPMPDDIRDALDKLTGRWAGTFTSYRPDGTVAGRLDVQQQYSWLNQVQAATFRETQPDGSEVSAVAFNYLTRDGTLTCRVEKPGNTTVHTGRLTADGQIVWHRRAQGVVESFKEHVAEIDGVTTYAIDGFGMYGQDHFLFEGRYRRVE